MRSSLIVGLLSLAIAFFLGAFIYRFVFFDLIGGLTALTVSYLLSWAISVVFVNLLAFAFFKVHKGDSIE